MMKRVAQIGLALVMFAWIVPAVHAHAVLLETSPPDGVRLEKSPAEIVLRFNEAVSPIALKVLDGSGREVGGSSELQSRDGALRKAISDLPPGGYVVSWRVSSSDAHPIGGALVFTVGLSSATPVQVAPPAGDGGWSAAVVAAKFILYLTLLSAAGAALFRALVCRPLGIASPESTAWTVGSAFAALFIAILAIGLKGGQLLASGPAALLELETWRAGASTSAGLSLLIVAGGAAALALTGRGRHASWRMILAAVIAVGGLCLTGHGATGPAWMPPLMAAHALAAAFWLGSLYPLLSLVSARHPARHAATVRFSRIAFPLVCLLLLSGAVVALTRIDWPQGLIATQYGQVLGIKLFLVTVMLVLAATNRLRVVPSMSAGDAAADAVLMRNIRLELLSGFFLILVTAVLAHTPPHSDRNDPVVNHHPAESTGHSGSSSARNMTLRFNVSPSAAGANALVVEMAGKDGKPLVPVEVSAGFSLPALATESIERSLVPVAPGKFRLDRIDLPVSGVWHLELVVLVNEFEKVSFTFDIPVHRLAGQVLQR